MEFEYELNDKEPERSHEWHSLFDAVRQDKTKKVWCLLSGECLETLVGHTDEIWCLKVLHDGGVNLFY